MASLKILNSFSKYIRMRPVASNSEMLIAGLTKCVVEHTLLKYEYTLVLTTYILQYPIIALPSDIFMVATITGAVGIYAVPAVRLLRSCKNSTLSIIEM